MLNRYLWTRKFDIMDPYVEVHERVLDIMHHRGIDKVPKRKFLKRDVIKDKKSEYVQKFLKEKNKKKRLYKAVDIKSDCEKADIFIEEKENKSKFDEFLIPVNKLKVDKSSKHKIKRPTKITQLISTVNELNKEEKKRKSEKHISSEKTQKVIEHGNADNIIAPERKAVEKEILDTFAGNNVLPELPLNKNNNPIDAKERLRSALQNEIDKDNRMVL